ncbi:hypothetical protein B1R94_00310 [Mycolicibacterium litorale]|nr:hypothetical protein B1R94_00310 [Mycolicibacterium litorale]
MNSGSTPSEQRERNRALYAAYLEACNEHDFTRMQSFYTPVLVVNDVPMPATDVTAQFAPVVAAFPDWRWEVKHLVVDDDYLSLHFRVTGTHRGSFQGIEATDRPVAVSQFTLYQVQGDKFTHVWDLADMGEVLRQISSTGAL